MKAKLIKKLLIVLIGFCACWVNAEVSDEEWGTVNKKGEEYMFTKYFDEKIFEMWVNTKDPTKFSVTIDHTECFESTQEKVRELNKCIDPKDSKTYVLSFKRHETLRGEHRIHISDVQLFDDKKKRGNKLVVNEVLKEGNCWESADSPLGDRRGPYFNKEGRELTCGCDYDGKVFEVWMDKKDPTKKCSITINGLHCFDSTEEALLEKKNKCEDPLDGKTYILSFERRREFVSGKGMMPGKKINIKEVKLVPSGEKVDL